MISTEEGLSLCMTPNEPTNMRSAKKKTIKVVNIQPLALFYGISLKTNKKKTINQQHLIYYHTQSSRAHYIAFVTVLFVAILIRTLYRLYTYTQQQKSNTNQQTN